MTDSSNFFAILNSATVAHRLLSKPIPDTLIDQLLDAATRAPTGVRTQPWSFIVLKSNASKRFFADRYLSALHTRIKRPVEEPNDGRADDVTRAAFEFAEVLHTAPAIILVCGKRGWPRALPVGRRLGRAPPSLAATFPCAQNILLASHALGLGAMLTTMHQLFEEELEHFLGLPEDIGVVAAIPIGYRADNIAPVAIRIKKPKKFYDAWGRKIALEP